MTGASRFLKAPLYSRNPVVYIPANLTDWEEISKLSERKEALKMLDADSMFANNSDDSGADDDNVDSSLDGDSDSGYEKYDELFE